MQLVVPVKPQYTAEKGPMFCKYSGLCTEIDQEKVARGHTVKISKQRANSRERQCVLGLREVNKWNSLTNDIVTASNIRLFKTRLEIHGMNKESKFDPSAHY